jgi:hypothetical protein
MRPNAMLSRLVVIVATACGVVSTARAQVGDLEELEMSGGRRYVIAFPDTTRNRIDERFPNRTFSDRAQLFLYASKHSTATITGPGFERTVAVPSNHFVVIDLFDTAYPGTRPIVDEHCRVVDNTYHIVATQPIVVYQFLLTAFGAEAWTALPVESWGREYYAAAFPGETVSEIDIEDTARWASTRRGAPAEIVVVAAYDSTDVVIEPTGSVDAACPLNHVTLMAGEAYSIESVVDTSVASPPGAQSDLAGTRITASRPIGVISGNTRAQLRPVDGFVTQNAYKNMQIEWLVPVEYHGVEHVYLPMLDSLRPGSIRSDEAAVQPRVTDIVRIYGTRAGRTGVSYRAADSVIALDSVERDGFVQVTHAPDIARVYTASQPVQATVSSTVYPRFAAVTWPGATAQFDALGGAMATMVPRERWGAFAPFIAPSSPGGMVHRVNVATDTAHMDDIILMSGARFPFTHRIDGTDLVWGMMVLTPGIEYWLQGRDGATFAGHVYGALGRGGHEELRLDPIEYEEHLGIAYAYPLASRAVVQGDGDSLRMEIGRYCDHALVRFVPVDADPAGIRSITLENGSNVRLDGRAADFGEARLVVVDTAQDASATLVVRDRTGRTTRWPITLGAPRFALSDSSIDFATVGPGTTATRDVTFRNSGDRPYVLTGLSVGAPFAATADRALPAQIVPGDSFTVDVRAVALAPGEYRDTLVVDLVCRQVRVPLLVRVDASGEVAIERTDVDALRSFEPNPFSSTIAISITLARAGTARLDIYDERGALVATLFDGHRDAGIHSVVFDARELAAGVYHCRLSSGPWSETRSIVKK